MGTLIPLESRRCTGCGRGAAEGARFMPRGNGYRPQCCDCENARRGGKGAGGLPDRATRERRAALHEAHAARYGRLARAEDDPTRRRRLLRAVRDHTTLAAEERAGRWRDPDEGDDDDGTEDGHRLD